MWHTSHTVKLTAKIKLQPAPDQHAALLKTLETANAACNYASRQAWDTRTFTQFPLHRVVYGELRERFELSAQVAVRAVGKVCDVTNWTGEHDASSDPMVRFLTITVF